MKLTTIFLEGPPKSNYRPDISESDFAELSDRAVRIRLMKMRDGGAVLDPLSQARLDRILTLHPEWPSTTTERDEFLVWSEGVFSVAPHEFEEPTSDYLSWSDAKVIEDLLEPTESVTMRRWRGLLQEDLRRSVEILVALGSLNYFADEIWSLALDYLGNQSKAECIRLFAEFTPRLGAEFISQNLHRFTGIIDRFIRETDREQDGSLWVLWDLLWKPAVEFNPSDDGDPVIQALNSSVGQLSEALLIGLVEAKPKSYGDISSDFKRRLEDLLTGTEPALRLARLTLAMAFSAWAESANRPFYRQIQLGEFRGSTTCLAWLSYGAPNYS